MMKVYCLGYAAISSVLLVATNAAGSWAIKTIDQSSDCGRVNSIAWDGTHVHMAWTCNTGGGINEVNYATGLPGASSFSVQTVGGAHNSGTKWVSVASDGTLAMVNTDHALKYARPVTPGTGNCPDNNNWSCELVSGSTDNTDRVQMSLDSAGDAWISYKHTDGRVRVAHRTAIDTFTYYTMYDPGTSGNSAFHPYLDATRALQPLGAVGLFIAPDTNFNDQVNVWFHNASVTSVYTPCPSNAYPNAVFVYADNPYVMCSKTNGRLYLQDYITYAWTYSVFTPESTTFEYGLYVTYSTALDYRISRSGASGLIFTYGRWNAWNDSLVDGAVDTGDSHLAPKDSPYAMVYYDDTNGRMKYALGSP